MYKSMALCALGQQGKGVELKTLIKLGDVGKCVCFSVFDLANGGMRREQCQLVSQLLVGQWMCCGLSAGCQ